MARLSAGTVPRVGGKLAHPNDAVSRSVGMMAAFGLVGALHDRFALYARPSQSAWCSTC